VFVKERKRRRMIVVCRGGGGEGMACTTAHTADVQLLSFSAWRCVCVCERERVSASVVL
jgi:hypothetical protein